MGVTVILNGYRRPEYLKEQYEAIVNSSVVPENIIYCQNSTPGVHYNHNQVMPHNIVRVLNNTNLGVWFRFSVALNARTKYVCIFDDDTIPGKNWLKNCIETYENFPGLLGTIGVIFPDNGVYHNVNRIGWDNPNQNTEQVDIVGHSWFFSRDMLSVFWRDLPPMNTPLTAGEDIHFSHMIQKYTPYGTYVPPHPKEDITMWGSLRGWEYGGDRKATAGVPENFSYMGKYLQYAKMNGFKTLKELGLR